MTTKSSFKPLSPFLDEILGPLTFGRFLRVARQSMELTQTEMAKRLGIARGTLCDIEKGRQTVTPTLAAKIAKTAGLSVAVAVQACLQDQVRKAGLKHTVKLVG